MTKGSSEYSEYFSPLEKTKLTIQVYFPQAQVVCGQVGLQGARAFLKMRFAVVQSTPALLCALRVSVEFCGLGIRNGFIDVLEGP